MKSHYKNIFFLLVAIAIAGIFASCSDDETGTPVIRYVRVTDPNSSDSLLVAAGQDQMIAIIGDNLGNVRELWVNDQRASLTSTLITNTSIIVRVPADLPKELTNQMTLIFSDGTNLVYPFKLAVAEPEVYSMVSEFVNASDVAIIKGNYFYPPLTVTFAGDVQGEVVSVEDEEIQVVVPEGAQPGPITVTTNFGEVESTLYFRDPRAFLNYDDLNSSGSWRPGTTIPDNGLDGNYLLLKGKLNANERAEDYVGGGYVSEFWAMKNGRPEGNLLPGKPEDYVMKFEYRAKDWYGSYLNICFAPWNHDASNQEYWSNDINARAYWGPWDAEDAPLTTDGWVTAVIPMTDFRYDLGADGDAIVYTSSVAGFKPEVTGSLTFWLIGSPKANGDLVELDIDNVRIVPK